MLLPLLTAVVFAGAAAASYGANLNYRSPSHNHPSLGASRMENPWVMIADFHTHLGIAIHKVNKRNGGSAPQNATGLNFTHGVASGDPYPTSVILWTRCAPMQDDVTSNSTVSGYVPLYNPVPIYKGSNGSIPVSTAPICISYKVAKDKTLSQVVDSGMAYTSSDVDYTLKVWTESWSPILRLDIDFLANVPAFRSKRNISVHTRDITTSSVFATQTSAARLGGLRPRLLPTTWSPKSVWPSTAAPTFPLASSMPSVIPPVRIQSITCSTLETTFTSTKTACMAMVRRLAVCLCRIKRSSLCTITGRESRLTGQILIFC